MKFAKLLVGLAAILIVVGCNTVQGMGKDIQKAGAAIERAGKTK